MYESPFWLLAHGRKEEVIEYFKRSAQVNEVELPENFEICHQIKVRSSPPLPQVDSKYIILPKIFLPHFPLEKNTIDGKGLVSPPRQRYFNI